MDLTQLTKEQKAKANRLYLTNYRMEKRICIA